MSNKVTSAMYVINDEYKYILFTYAKSGCSTVRIIHTYLTYPNCINEDFLERLIISMEAGERAGGDKRGRQAAGIIIHMGQDYPWIDLRVDDHSDPLS